MALINNEELIAKLKEKGLLNTQIDSKGVQVIFETLAEECGVETAMIEHWFLRQFNLLKSKERDLEQLLYSLDCKTKNGNITADKLDALQTVLSNREEDLMSMVPEDVSTLNALSIYINVLKFTRDIFGEEKMTEEVMKTAIQAGSYGLWQSIIQRGDR